VTQSYTARLHGPARRGVTHTLPPAVAFACLEFVEGPLSESPRRVGRELWTPRQGQWSARRGEYRIIYAIDDASMTVHVLDVSHRRVVYR